jgi:hypothetical protein
MMTPDELRALADALEPMSAAPRFDCLPVVEFCAWLRQCADAKPVAWRVECRWTDRSKGGGWRKYADYGTEQAAASSQQVFAKPGDIESRIVPLFTHPAPAAPQAEPVATVRVHRTGGNAGIAWSAVPTGAQMMRDGDLLYAAPQQADEREPCIGNDPACPCQDGDPCHYRDTETTKAWPVPQVDQKREPWSGYEAGHRAGYALALTERRTDDCTFETDTPDEHTHIEEVRALLRGDTGLKEQAKPPRQAGQEISLGALMREQRQSRIVAGAYPDGNPNAGAMMAQTPQAGPQREPLSDGQLASVCLSYRHDFGLLNKDEQARLMLEARDWERAFRKEWQREPLSDEPPSAEWLSKDDAETQLALAMRYAAKIAPSTDDKALLDALSRRGIWLAWIGGSDAE